MMAIGRLFVSLVLAGLVVAGFITFDIHSAEAGCDPLALGPLHAMASAKNLYLIWEQDTWSISNGMGNHTIYFKKSSDGGKTFGETINLSTSGSICYTGAQMVVAHNPRTGLDNVYVLWSADGKMLLKASNNSGTTFGNTIVLGNGYLGYGPPSFLTYNADIVTDSNNGVYVAWTYSEPQANYAVEVFFTESTDGGRTFSGLARFSNTSADYQDVQLAADGQNVYLTWSEDTGCKNLVELSNCHTEVVFAKSTDRGKSFGSPQVLAEGNSTWNGGSVSKAVTDDTNNNRNATGNNNNAPCASIYCGLPNHPDIYSAGKNLYLTWQYSAGSIFFIHSSENGTTFSPPVNITASFTALNPTAYPWPPFLHAYSNILYLEGASISNKTGITVYLLKSTDGGTNFQQTVIAIPNSSISYDNQLQPFQLTDGGMLYLTWTSSDNSKIQFEALKIEENNQSSMSTNPSVIYSSSKGSFIDSWLISAATDSGNVYVISTNGSREIFLRASDDYGNSFREITNVQEIQNLPEFNSHLIQLVMAGATVSVVGIGILAKRRFGYG